MKTIKSLSKLLLLCIVLTFTTCQKEDEIIEIEQSNVKRYSRGKLSDFSKLNNFVRKDILEYKDNKAQLERTSTEDTYDFTIINNDILSIEEPGLTTYTIKIVKDAQEENSFSNLLVKFADNEQPAAKIINYYPSQNYLDNIEAIPDMLFEGEVNMEDVDYDGSLDYLFRGAIYCTTISVDVCGWSGTVAGDECYSDPDKSDHIETYPVTVCYETNPFIDAGDSNGGNGTAGPPPSGGGTTTPTYIPPCEQESALNSDDTGLVNNDGCITTVEAEARNTLYERLATVLEDQAQADWIGSPSTDINIIYGLNDYLDSSWSNNLSEYKNNAVRIIQNSLEGLTTNQETMLTISTLLNDTPWLDNPGVYNGIPSLAYTQTRLIISNGRVHNQYKLANGDILSSSSYPPSAGSSELVDVLFYFNQQTGLWYDFQEPSSYSPLTLDFLWDGFWIATRTVIRYTTSFEDVLILISGRDLEGVEQSRAVAGTFILIDLIPGSSAVKALKLVKYGDEAVQIAEAVVKYVDDAYKAQKTNIQYVLDNIIDLEELGNSIRKSNFGEMVTDTDLFSKGYEPLHVRRTNIDQPIDQGIDGVFKNPETGEFLIVESKFGTSSLNTLADGTRQMSDPWITNGLNNASDRLFQEIGQDVNLYNQIMQNGYTRLKAKVTETGIVSYKLINSDGYVILGNAGIFTP